MGVYVRLGSSAIIIVMLGFHYHFLLMKQLPQFYILYTSTKHSFFIPQHISLRKRSGRRLLRRRMFEHSRGMDCIIDCQIELCV